MGYQVLGNNSNASNIDNSIPIGVSLNFNTPDVFIYNFLTEQQVKDNLINVLLTQKGERIENVKFGCELLSLIFQPVSEQFNDAVSEIIRDCLAAWMPYIIIQNIDIKTVLDDPTLEHNVIISLTFNSPTYSIINSEVVFSVNNNGSLEIQ